MKKKLLLAGLLFFCLQAMAQSTLLTGTKIENDYNDQASQIFRNYSLVHIDPEQMSNTVSGHVQKMDLDIRLAGCPETTVHLIYNPVFSGDYFTLIGDNREVRKDLSTPEVFTFIQQNNDNVAAFTFSPQSLYGQFHANGESWFIEPLRNFDRTQDKFTYVVYRHTDVKESEATQCMALEVEVDNEVSDRDIPSRLCAKKQLDIAIANDFSIFLKYGSVPAAIDHNAAVVNAQKANFDNEFIIGIPLQIVTQYFPISAEDDPFLPMTQTNRTVLLLDFQDWANDGGFGTSNYDFAKWMTNRTIFNNGQVVLGSAFSTQFNSNLICSEYRYGIFSDAPNYTIDQYRHIHSHELGHNFGCSHTASGIMEGVFTGVTSNIWAPASSTIINNNLSGILCLATVDDDCAPPVSLPQPAPFVAPLIAGPAYEGSLTVCATVDDPCVASLEFGPLPEGMVLTYISGTTACFVAYNGFLLTRVEVWPLNTCGDRMTKLPFEWYFSAWQPLTGDPVERNLKATSIHGIDLIASNDVVRVDDHLEQPNRTKEILIFDISGRLMLQQSFQGANWQTHVDLFAPGMYIVQIRTEGESVTRKFVHN